MKINADNASCVISSVSANAIDHKKVFNSYFINVGLHEMSNSQLYDSNSNSDEISSNKKEEISNEMSNSNFSMPPVVESSISNSDDISEIANGGSSLDDSEYCKIQKSGLYTDLIADQNDFMFTKDNVDFPKFKNSNFKPASECSSESKNENDSDSELKQVDTAIFDAFDLVEYDDDDEASLDHDQWPIGLSSIQKKLNPNLIEQQEIKTISNFMDPLEIQNTSEKIKVLSFDEIEKNKNSSEFPTSSNISADDQPLEIKFLNLNKKVNQGLDDKISILPHQSISQEKPDSIFSITNLDAFSMQNKRDSVIESILLEEVCQDNEKANLFDQLQSSVLPFDSKFDKHKKDASTNIFINNNNSRNDFKELASMNEKFYSNSFLKPLDNISTIKVHNSEVTSKNESTTSRDFLDNTNSGKNEIKLIPTRSTENEIINFVPESVTKSSEQFSNSSNFNDSKFTGLPDRNKFIEIKEIVSDLSDYDSKSCPQTESVIFNSVDEAKPTAKFFDCDVSYKQAFTDTINSTEEEKKFDLKNMDNINSHKTTNLFKESTEDKFSKNPNIFNVGKLLYSDDKTKSNLLTAIHTPQDDRIGKKNTENKNIGTIKSFNGLYTRNNVNFLTSEASNTGNQQSNNMIPFSQSFFGDEQQILKIPSNSQQTIDKINIASKFDKEQKFSSYEKHIDSNDIAKKDDISTPKVYKEEAWNSKPKLNQKKLFKQFSKIPSGISESTGTILSSLLNQVEVLISDKNNLDQNFHSSQSFLNKKYLEDVGDIVEQVFSQIICAKNNVMNRINDLNDEISIYNKNQTRLTELLRLLSDVEECSNSAKFLEIYKKHVLTISKSTSFVDILSKFDVIYKLKKTLDGYYAKSNSYAKDGSGEIDQKTRLHSKYIFPSFESQDLKYSFDELINNIPLLDDLQNKFSFIYQHICCPPTLNNYIN